MSGWRDDPKLELYLFRPMLVLALILLGIAVQFGDPKANAYFLIAILTIIGYLGSHVSGLNRIFAWQGLGTTKTLLVNAGVGVGLYAVVVVLGTAISLPLAISGGVVLNVLYRWMSAVIFEEGCFRSFLYPTFKMWFKNTALAGAALSGIAWSYFHVVAFGADPSGIIMVAFIGFVFAMANEYMKSSVPSYTAHAIWNGLKVLV